MINPSVNSSSLPVAQPPNTSPPAMPPTPTKNGEAEPTTVKKFLPAMAFFVAFFLCITLLLIYMDNTAMKHHQFRVNMSQDYELLGIAQDNEELITYIREVHLAPAIEPHHPPILSNLTEPPEDTAYVIKLLNNKKEGIFIESGAYGDGKTSETEWLEKHLNWRGLLIQPDPRHFFKLRRHNRTKSQAIHACLSPTSYPKEVTFHQEERDGVKIHSVHTNLVDDPDWFNTRVKCFPFYSLLLAMNVTNIDYFCLESNGTELQVLETIPFEKVQIEVIDVHLLSNETEYPTIKKFLANKNYNFMRNFDKSYIFMRK